MTGLSNFILGQIDKYVETPRRGVFVPIQRRAAGASLRSCFLILVLLTALFCFQVPAFSEANKVTREQEGTIPDAPIIREQAAVFENTETKELPERKSFWRYALRVMAAPVMILVNFPRDEEREVSQTYYEYINQGTSRQWRGKEEKDIKPGHDIKYLQNEGGGKEKDEHATDAPHEAGSTTAH